MLRQGRHLFRGFTSLALFLSRFLQIPHLIRLLEREEF